MSGRYLARRVIVRGIFPRVYVRGYLSWGICPDTKPNLSQMNSEKKMDTHPWKKSASLAF